MAQPLGILELFCSMSTVKRSSEATIMQPPVRELHHFINLSRGLLCPCRKPKAHIIRLQSTRCEQKQWGQLIHDAGPELLFAVASGHVAIVHDVDEQLRETRACWQGLSWLRYACHKAWNEGSPPQEKVKHGLILDKYWQQEWDKLPRGTRHWLKYFKQFHKPETSLYLRSCWHRGGGRLPAAIVAALEPINEQFECYI